MNASRRSRPVVLTVDDDAAVRSALSLILEDSCEVLEAGDAPAALDLLTRRAVDLVLLDVLLPGMGGLALLERLRAVLPCVPVVLVTALDEARTAVAAMKLGAVDYFTKPFGEDEILGVVRRALARRRDGERRMVLIGGGAGARAGLAVLFRVWWPVEVPPAGADLGQDAAAVSGVAVVDVSTARGTDVIRRIRARMPLIDMIVVNADEPSAFVGVGSAGCRAALRRPLKCAELFDEVAALLPSTPGDASCPRLSPLVGRIVDHVIGHFPDASVEHVARDLATSPDHLSRLFRETTSVTLKSFLNKVRMEAAKCLLAETDDKLEALAERLGLYGAAHLSRVFVQHCGERPGSYRRSANAKN